MTEFVGQVPESFHRDCERCMAAALGDDTEEFRFGFWRWDVNKARQLLPGSHFAIETPVESLTQVIGFMRISQDHADHVDPDKPIIIARIEVDGIEQWLPIDGWHRIRRALDTGRTTISAYLLTIDESQACRLDQPMHRPSRRARTHRA